MKNRIVRSILNATIILSTCTVAVESSAGPVGNICFDEGCCWIGARDNRINCTQVEIKCAEQLIGHNFDGLIGWNQSSVGSLVSCGLACEVFGDSFDGKRLCSQVDEDVPKHTHACPPGWIPEATRSNVCVPDGWWSKYLDADRPACPPGCIPTGPYSPCLCPTPP